MLQMKIDHFQILMMEKDIDISRLKGEVERARKEGKVNEDKVRKEYERKMKEMENPEKKLVVEQKTVDLRLQIVVSEKMLPIDGRKLNQRVEKSFARNIMSMSEGRYSGRRANSSKNMSRQSSIELTSK